MRLYFFFPWGWENASVIRKSHLRPYFFLHRLHHRFRLSEHGLGESMDAMD